MPPREALDPPVDPLEPPFDPPNDSPWLPDPDPLIPPEPLLLPDPEREPLPVLPDPLIPPDPPELPDEPDEPWSFLFRSFAIRPPALLGRTDLRMNLCGAMPPLRTKKSNIHANSDFYSVTSETRFVRQCPLPDRYMGANTFGAKRHGNCKM